MAEPGSFDPFAETSTDSSIETYLPVWSYFIIVPVGVAICVGIACLFIHHKKICGSKAKKSTSSKKKSGSRPSASNRSEPKRSIQEKADLSYQQTPTIGPQPPEQHFLPPVQNASLTSDCSPPPTRSAKALKQEVSKKKTLEPEKKKKSSREVIQEVQSEKSVDKKSHKETKKPETKPEAIPKELSRDEPCTLVCYNSKWTRVDNLGSDFSFEIESEI